MERQTLILIGGYKNGDYDWLKSHEGAKRTWSCPKAGQVGDTVYFYVTHPRSEIIASAVVTKAPRPGRVWRYEGQIGPIRNFPAPIPLAELKRMFPDWGWLRYPRAYAYAPSDVGKQLARRALLKIPPVENAEVEVRSAGFGDPETNRRIERAAVDAVRRYFRNKGLRVRSRESEKVGYDLDIKSSRTTLHVEVKGVSNAVLAFPISSREVNKAKSDPNFRLAVVTQALDRRLRRIHLFTGKQFLSRFQCKPLAFMATTKPGRWRVKFS